MTIFVVAKFVWENEKINNFFLFYNAVWISVKSEKWSPACAKIMEPNVSNFFGFFRG